VVASTGSALATRPCNDIGNKNQQPAIPHNIPFPIASLAIDILPHRQKLAMCLFQALQ
jgi:hypothetical protein